MNVSITQSREWQKLQDDLGKPAFLSKKKDYQFLAITESTPVGDYLYLPYGPVYRTPAGFRHALADLETYAREQHAIFVRIEPQDPDFAQYAPKNAQKTHDLNPRETWLLDLTGNDDALNARLPSRLLRYHRTASKKGITVETSHDPADIHYLFDLQKALANQKGINTFSEHYLATELSQPFATLYLVKQHPADQPAPEDSAAETPDAPSKSTSSASDVPSIPNPSDAASKPTSSAPTTAVPPAPDSSSPTLLAAGLVFDDQTTRYNLQGAQSEQGRQLHATGILTIQLILDARAKGLKTFDFWGIAPPDAPADHPWAGFTAFKKTFAGTEKDYAGTYDLVLHSAKYRLYRSLRSLNRLFRRTSNSKLNPRS